MTKPHTSWKERPDLTVRVLRVRIYASMQTPAGLLALAAAAAFGCNPAWSPGMTCSTEFQMQRYRVQNSFHHPLPSHHTVCRLKRISHPPVCIYKTISAKNMNVIYFFLAGVMCLSVQAFKYVSPRTLQGAICLSFSPTQLRF